uniref:Acetyltransferase component of pyruvate dehydrogenase complex n=1 Tax=Auxenochlorella protothecoides TaxID=3075 RepID=A0A1D2ADL1_AUXPR
MALRQRCPALARGIFLHLARREAAGGWAWTAAAAPCPTLPSTCVPACVGAWRTFASGSLPEHTELAMPALSPTMNQGNILEWQKKVGDTIAPGDIYCEVETDKASMEWEAQEEGFLARIVAGNNTKDVPVGQVVAIIVENEEDIPAFKDWAPGASSEPAPAPAKEAPGHKEAAAPAKPAPKPKKGGKKAAKPTGRSWPPHEILTMPALSPTMSQGNILEWKKKAGETVAPGDVWAEVETDKASMEWEAQEEGVVAKLLCADGASGVAVGHPLVVLVEEGADITAFADFTDADAQGGAGGAAGEGEAEEAEGAKEVKPAKEAKEAKPAASAKPAKSAAPGARVVASPYAKKLAEEAGVSLQGVAGSGEGGRITAADVRELVESGGGKPVGGAGDAGAQAAAASWEGEGDDVAHSQIRRITAQRLLESKQTVPHYYLSVSVRVDELAALRARLNADLAKADGGKLSVNDFVVKASALALRRFPAVNASWHADYIRQYHDVDISIAVQTPAGLMVPIVRDADAKGLAAIAADVRRLAGKAKEGKLRPEEFTGGTFTISNLGMYGVSQFSAIINPPQACILAVGAAEPRVVRGAAGGFEEAQFLQATLSCDHRVVDGALGAQWLQAFKGYLENPASMLL